MHSIWQKHIPQLWQLGPPPPALPLTAQAASTRYAEPFYSSSCFVPWGVLQLPLAPNCSICLHCVGLTLLLSLATLFTPAWCAKAAIHGTLSTYSSCTRHGIWLLDQVSKKLLMITTAWQSTICVQSCMIQRTGRSQECCWSQHLMLLVSICRDAQQTDAAFNACKTCYLLA